LLENILSESTKLLKRVLFRRFISIRSALVRVPREFYIGAVPAAKLPG